MVHRASHSDRLQLTAANIGHRLRYLGIDAADVHNLDTVHGVIDPHLDAIAEAFCAHLLQFEPLQPFLTGPGVQQRLRRTMVDYLRTLGRDVGSLQYAEQRLHIGLRHERLGVSLRWYLGAFPQLFSDISARLRQQLPDQAAELGVSLHKILGFDAELAAESYHRSSLDRVQELMQQLERRQQRLQESSRHDDLTGVLTRGAALEALELELHRALRFRQHFAVLVLDIDRFKLLNDQHGHAFGDLVLTRVAAMCSRMIRPWDVVGRLGGDELVIGLLGCPLREAVHIAERIRLEVAAAEFERGADAAPVTLSIGVAALARETQQLELLLEAADRALYRAKEHRNRVCSEAPPARTGEADAADASA